MRWLLRSKIHNATVTDARVDYVGSITIDEELMAKAGLLPNEKVMVVDNTNGARVDTYVIPGEPGSGTICMNGASARLIKKGHQVIIMGFELTDREIEPQNALVDKNNRFLKYL